MERYIIVIDNNHPNYQFDSYYKNGKYLRKFRPAFRRREATLFTKEEAERQVAILNRREASKKNKKYSYTYRVEEA